MTIDLDALEALLAAATPGRDDAAVETRARLIAATKMGLVKDPDGKRLPDEMWRQAIPNALAEFDRAATVATMTALPELLRLARVGQAAVDERAAWLAWVHHGREESEPREAAWRRCVAAERRFRSLREDALAATRAEAGR